MLQGQLPRPSDIMSLRIDNGERATLEYADIALSPTRYIASWLRQRGWRLPEYRCERPMPGACSPRLVLFTCPCCASQSTCGNARCLPCLILASPTWPE